VGADRTAGLTPTGDFDALLTRIRACRICADQLPLGPRPVLQAAPSASLLIVGQAPGRRVHDTGVPFNDPSGDRLRDWLGLDRASFYDASTVALVPMGFCYPGRTGAGDAPPRPECAPAWRSELLSRLGHVRLTVAAGRYAHAYHLPQRGSVTEVVRSWRHSGDVVPIPHPSPRNTGWLRRNPWFEAEVVPYLRDRVRRVLDG
jgi:uracil-DNA glycosylase